MFNESNWEMIEVSSELQIDTEAFDFACCGSCGWFGCLGGTTGDV